MFHLRWPSRRCAAFRRSADPHTKALLLRRIGNGLPKPFRFRPAGDLATEIEWAKNRRLTPATYLGGLGDHEPPLPADLSVRVFREYEKRKAEAGSIDFEDLLGLAIGALEDDEQALATVRSRWQAFTVDEYQDVNLLQQTLLDLWLGERDDVRRRRRLPVDLQLHRCERAVAARVAAALPARPRRAARAELPLDAAGARAREPARAEARRLREDAAPDARRRPEPELLRCSTPEEQAMLVTERVRALLKAGVKLEEQAVLVRTNARAADFEEAFHDAGIPFQGASLLARDAARQLIKALGSGGSRPTSR